MFPIKSRKLLDAEQCAYFELKKQYKGSTIKHPVHIQFLFYRGDRRRVDLSNLYEFAQDALQEAGVIEDDYLIESHDGSRRLYDKLNPRTEIIISDFAIDK